MQASESLNAVSTTPGIPDPRPHALREIIEHAAHVLPAQGPITVFIHHNTLHAFEDLPFHEALKKGAQIFGCQTYLSEDRYRVLLAHGLQAQEQIAVPVKGNYFLRVGVHDVPSDHIGALEIPVDEVHAGVAELSLPKP